MNKAELILKVAEKSGVNKKQAESVVSAMLDVIVEAIANDEKVQIVGFGTFEQRERKERNGVNPRTEEKIVIPASKIPAFKPGKNFKDAVNA